MTLCQVDKRASANVPPACSAASPGCIPIQGVCVAGQLLLLLCKAEDLTEKHVRALVPEHPVACSGNRVTHQHALA